MINTTITESPCSEQIVQPDDIDHNDDRVRLLADDVKHISFYTSYLEKNMLLPKHYSEDEVLNLDKMRKIFKEQHPWSVSDPFPVPFIPELFSSREYNSLPNLKHGVERKHRHDLDSFSVQDTLVSTLVGKKPLFKWVIIVLNVFIELCQATITQESSQGKLKREIYLKLSILASSICLIMSIIEIFHEFKSNRVIWVKKSYLCCWFYHPGTEGELFGSFALYFGLISSIVQVIVNVTQKITKKSPVKFDYLPLLLSVCYLVAAIIGCREKTSRGEVRCKIHGYNVVDGVLVEGHDSWVFECPQCDFEISC